MYTKIIYLDVISLQEGYFAYELEPEANVFIYTLEGNLAIADSTVKKSEAALLTTGNKVEVKTEKNSRFVLIGGKPHREPIILKGSFVY